MGDGGWRLAFSVQRLAFSAQRPTPNAQRPTLNAQRSTLNAPRPAPGFDKLSLNGFLLGRELECTSIPSMLVILRGAKRSRRIHAAFRY
jgi:hypothetical protein